MAKKPKLSARAERHIMSEVYARVDRLRSLRQWMTDGAVGGAERRAYVSVVLSTAGTPLDASAVTAALARESGESPVDSLMNEAVARLIDEEAYAVPDAVEYSHHGAVVGYRIFY
jgi:hypothetical protein